MTTAEVMKKLESLGTAQNRKVYARHGAAPESTFGVSFAELFKLQKAIKRDQPLALELWDTGNNDARSLATLIADPQQMRAKDLDRWVNEVNVYGLADLIARHVASQSPHARKKAEAWSKSKQEYVGQTGWDLIGMLAMYDASLPDSYVEEHLRVIERDIHRSKNRVRHAMNGVLIGIGMRNQKLRKLALAAAGRIGKVEVDHGETGCKTPDAAAYIQKAAGRAKNSGR